ncbi:hypothetical protein S83_005991, partial [Arachis hypogaea]
EVANLDGVGFTPHVVNLHGRGCCCKDHVIRRKVSRRNLCSFANGAISSVTLDRSVLPVVCGLM